MSARCRGKASAPLCNISPGARSTTSLFAAGEILQSGAEAFPRQRADIHLDPLVTYLGAGLVFAASKNLADFRMGHKAVEHGRSSRAGHQQIDIAHCFPPAA